MTGDIRFLPALALVSCLALLYPLQRRIDAEARTTEIREEYLYLSQGEDLRRLSFGYHSLLADFYWLRAVQYFGSKVQSDPTVLNERGNRLALLHPFIDITTTLDPQFIPPYRVGGYFIHDYVDEELGVRILDKGIRANPDEWRLYTDKAFLLWSAGDCSGAAALYDMAAARPGAPDWLNTMGPTTLAECGDLEAAREKYDLLLGTVEDEHLRQFIVKKRAGLDAKAEVDALVAGVHAYRAAEGANPPSLARLLQSGHLPPDTTLRLNENGQPVDPLGQPYVYNPEHGTVTAAPNGVVLPVKIFQNRDASEGAPAGK